MNGQIKDRMLVFIVSHKNATRRLRKEIDKAFVVRAELGEVMLVDVSVRKIGDLATTKGTVEVYEDAIPQTSIKTLSRDAARLAEIWNRRLQARRSADPISDSDIDKLLKRLELEVIDGTVIDKRTKKSLGKVNDG